jgi:hypothetical protein
MLELMVRAIAAHTSVAKLAQAQPNTSPTQLWLADRRSYL